jgi:hypothetical protein
MTNILTWLQKSCHPVVRYRLITKPALTIVFAMWVGKRARRVRRRALKRDYGAV